MGGPYSIDKQRLVDSAAEPDCAEDERDKWDDHGRLPPWVEASISIIALASASCCVRTAESAEPITDFVELTVHAVTQNAAKSGTMQYVFNVLSPLPTATVTHGETLQIIDIAGESAKFSRNAPEPKETAKRVDKGGQAVEPPYL
jgi:hypothetical protein